MKAVILDSTGLRVVSDYPVPTPVRDEILVRVLQAGICETDLQLIQGYMGYEGVLGHEFVGIAESGALQGERVVGEINCSCHKCGTCKDGLANHCPHRTVLGILQHDGAFAEYICVPACNLHQVPETVSTDAAVFTEPLAAAFQIPAQIKIDRSSRALVLGDGRLGNLCSQVLKLSGCQVTTVGKHPRKLQLLQNLDIETVLLDDLQPTKEYDLVVDCTGSAAGLPIAVQHCKPRGTVVLKTTVAGEQTLSLAPIVIDEITVVGSRCGPFATALSALQQDLIDVLPLISSRFPLEQGDAAIEEARVKPVLKVILDV
jgi:threonine dehydrogenase-like Zn-dependent dehydrogenase